MTATYEPAPGWDSPPAGRCRPGMTELRKYLVETFGGTDLGCYNNRAKTGGSTTSLHRDGRAVDVGWLQPDGTLHLDRREAAYEWLIAHADAIGLQMVLNYSRNGYGGTRWRLPYYPGETKAGRGTWAKGGHWLHIERTYAGADDPRPIAELVAAGTPRPSSPPPPATTPAPASAPAPSETVTVTVDMPTVAPKSSTASAVRQVQTLLNLKGGKSLAVDGDYGRKTQQAVRDWQRFFGMTVDAVVGRQTWETLLVVWGHE